MLDNRFAAIVIIFVGLLTSCVSSGSLNLSENVIDDVIEGETSKNQVLSLLGLPEQSLKLDQSGLDNYINRLFSTRVSQNTILEGQYELWVYDKWSYFAVDPFLIPSRETYKLTVLIFDHNDICIKKLYDEKTVFKF